MESVRWTVKYHTHSIEIKLPGGGKEYISRLDKAERFGAECSIPEEPDVPDLGGHILAWFWMLNGRRSAGFDSPNPLSFQEIYAWIALTNTPILYEEIEALLAMDMAYLTQMAENRQAQRQQAG